MNSAISLPSADELRSRRGQMFPPLSEAQLARVRPVGTEVTFADGATVWSQGDEDVPWFIVLEGELAVVHPSRGAEEHVTTHGVREFTGESNMLAGRRALVSGRAKGPLKALRVAQDRLRTILQTDSDLSDLIVRAFILRRVGLLSAGYGDAVVIGSKDSSATLRLQAFLTRNGHPYKWVDIDCKDCVQNLLDNAKVDVHDLPILICRGEIRHVFSMAGADPNTRWLEGCVALDEQGFVRTGADLDRETLTKEGWPLGRPPYLFETSQPRVFAVGDLRSASVKRVASAVGDGSVCIQLVHRALAD